MRLRRHFFLSNKAQTASELAIFGAIVIFVIGIIVRAAMSASQIQNHQLKAMRMAMTQSYQSSIVQGRTARNTASIIFVEDRLSVDPNSKLAVRDRIPLIVNAGAMFSNQLFQPIDYGENRNLAVFDLIVNGQQFPLTSAAFRMIQFDSTHPDWQEHCYSFEYQPPALVIGDPLPPTVHMEGGCVVSYHVVGNYEGSSDWCDGKATGIPCTENLPAEDRFDLNRDGETDVPDDVEGLRQNFNWQWILVPGIVKKRSWVSALDGVILQDTRGNRLVDLEGMKKGDIYDVDFDFKEEILHDFGTQNNGCGHMPDLDPDTAGCQNPVGTACPIIPGVDPITGVVNCVRVTDSQMGDVNFTMNDLDKINGMVPPGLQDDVQMYSFTRDIDGGPVGNERGTYLRVEEGKLFDPASGQFIRNTTRQNHVDIIQRIFRLSNDTDRFCNKASSPTCWDPGVQGCAPDPENDPKKIGGVRGLANPVEVCNECFSEDNVSRTCMDETRLMIFIRSRIADFRGRRWVTHTDL